MTHLSRLEWLTARGFLPENRQIDLPTLGTCLWVDGHKGRRPVSLWLSVRDGVAVIHGAGSQDLTWEQLQEWIDPKPEPEKEPVKVQKSFFED